MAADFRKQMGPFITARRDPKVVRLPALKFLRVDGRGDPAKGKEFREAVQALYTLAYTLKFSGKPGSRQRQMPVLPLDALWWMPGHKGFPGNAPRSAWRWQAMLAMPGFVTEAMVAKVCKDVLAAHSVNKTGFT